MSTPLIIKRINVQRSYRCFNTSLKICQIGAIKNKNVKSQPQSIQHTSRDVEIQRIRNIGIMAHIDAGKTTTTERVLYYSGLTRHLGNVDKGDTVMDYMEQERNRGITITSAAITFFWNKHRINLIDTPGHVDFTLEVERSLRVLDGAVTILDASAGVEAQTLTVWRQADKYKIPRIIYLNKMDKNGACHRKCVDSIIEKLHSQPLILQVPVGKEKSFQGFVDLVTCKKYTWNLTDSDGRNFEVNKLEKSKEPDLYDEVESLRRKLIEQLADIDDCIANHVINETAYDDIPAVDLMNAIRKATLTQAGIPILCGSSVKNRGVQPLMNAIISFLPNPSERHNDFVQYYGNNLCALAFKIIHDKQRGPLTFMRIYSGTLKSASKVYNVNRDANEKLGKLLEIFADETKELPSVSCGNIVAVTGFTQTVSGDTLTSSSSHARLAENLYTKDRLTVDDEAAVAPVLAGLEVPEPVFMCSVEPPSLAFEKQLNQGLECLKKEDPSLRTSVDEDTGQTILSGMGELHLEIIKDRLLKEYGVEAYMGPLVISYREAISQPIEESNEFDRTIGKTHHKASIQLTVKPEPGFIFDKVDFILNKDSQLDVRKLRKPQLDAINNGVKSALSRGPILGSKVVNVRVEVHDFQKTFKTSLPIVSACVAQCVTKALKKADPVLLQPMMSLEIHTEEDYLSRVIADLAKRHSNIMSVDAQHKMRSVKASTPLSQMVGYSTSLRTLSSGCASFTMELSHFEPVDGQEQEQIIEKIKSFRYL